MPVLLHSSKRTPGCQTRTLELCLVFSTCYGGKNTCFLNPRETQFKEVEALTRYGESEEDRAPVGVFFSVRGYGNSPLATTVLEGILSGKRSQGLKTFPTCLPKPGIRVHELGREIAKPIAMLPGSQFSFQGATAIIGFRPSEGDRPMGKGAHTATLDSILEETLGRPALIFVRT